VIGVDLSVLLPLVREIIESENGRYGADWNASAAIDTFHRIYVKLRGGLKFRLVFFGMDAVYGTRIHTRSVFGADTGLGNYISHIVLLHAAEAWLFDYGSTTDSSP
jgi:hypothetical protein